MTITKPIGPGLFEWGEKVHSPWPEYIRPELGYTAEVADGLHVGTKMQITSDHVLRYRLGGACHWSVFRTEDRTYNYPSGTLYIPIHYPPWIDAGTSKRRLLIYLQFSSADPGAWYVKWRDSFGTGAYTTLWSGDDLVYTTAKTAVLEYAAPTGTGASCVKCIEIAYDNLYPASFSAYHLGEVSSSDENILVAAGNTSTGMLITDEGASFGGLIYAVGIGTVNTPSMERLTRRCWFNQTHPQGSICDDGDSAWHDMFETPTGMKMTWPIRGRNLTGRTSEAWGIPVAVVSATGQGHGLTVALRYRSAVTGHSWTYTMQASETEGIPYLIHPWGVGSSSASGLAIAADTEDTISIEGYTDSSSSITLLGWSLFEGDGFITTEPAP